MPPKNPLETSQQNSGNPQKLRCPTLDQDLGILVSTSSPFSLDLPPVLFHICTSSFVRAISFNMPAAADEGPVADGEVALPVLDPVMDYEKIKRIGEGTFGVVCE